MIFEIRHDMSGATSTALHTILLNGPNETIVDNHRWYCEQLDYTHRCHTWTSPGNGAHAQLVYKYSVIRKTLGDMPDGMLLLFADETTAMYAPLDAAAIMGDGWHWLVENPDTHRPEGNLLMLRVGEPATALVDAILARLRLMPSRETTRWSGLELEGIVTRACDALIDGIHHPNLLFASFGHHLPEFSAFALSLNPDVHDNTHDARMDAVFVSYLTAVLRRGARLYDDFPDTGSADHYEVINPGQPIALVTSYTPNIAVYGCHSAANVTDYARRHGYTHHIYRTLPADLQDSVAGNWVKPALLLRHLAAHAQVAWIDADILIHDVQRPLSAITQGRPMTLARDIEDSVFNSGFMVFSNAPASLDYLHRVQAMVDDVSDKSSVYVSGGDQSYFVAAWQQLGGQAFVPLTDCVSCNSHPALYDGESFMLHYMGYPKRIRGLAMRHDSQQIAARHGPDSALQAAPTPAWQRIKRRLHFTHFLELSAPHYDDIIESFRLAAEELGYESTYAHATVLPGATNILLFAWRVIWTAMLPSHPDCIVFNFEQLTPTSKGMSASYQEVLRHCYLWEYSRSNFQKNLSLEFHQADLVPLGYQAGAAGEASEASGVNSGIQDIDVVFFGETTPRRNHVLSQLRARGVSVCMPAPEPWTNDERDHYLRRAKLVINIHQFDNSRIVEIPRLTILLRQRKAVVCELYADSDIEPGLRHAVEGSPYETLVDTTLRLLADPVRRAELEKNGYDRLIGRPQKVILATALDRYFQWRSQQITVDDRQHALARRQRVTVIVAAARAHSAALELTLKSLARQHHKAFTVVVVSGENADSHYLHDQRAPVAIRRLGLNGPWGSAAAFNRGLNSEIGEFVMFVEAGDTGAPEQLQRLTDFMLLHPEIDVAGSWTAGANADQAVRRVSELDHEIRAEFLSDTRHLAPTSCLYRVNFLERHALHFDAAFGVAGARHFVYQSAIARARFGAVAAPLCQPAVAIEEASNADRQANDLHFRRARRTLLVRYFPSLLATELDRMAELQALNWTPDLSFARAMLGVLAKASTTSTPEMNLDRATVTRTLLHEAVRLVHVYRRAGLVDAGWIASLNNDFELANFLAPARDQLMG